MRYGQWERRGSKSVMCYFAAGFTQDWAVDQPPLGLCLENGRIINRNVDPKMDGLVIMDHNGIREIGDLSSRGSFRHDLRQVRGRAAFLHEAQRLNYSCFQTQLMYSRTSGRLMGDPWEGKRASRRFLAICHNSRGEEYHLILDLACAAPERSRRSSSNPAYRSRLGSSMPQQDTGSPISWRLTIGGDTFKPISLNMRLSC